MEDKKDYFQSKYGDISKFPEPKGQMPKGKRLTAPYFKCVAERMLSEWVNNKCIYPYAIYGARSIETLTAYATGRQNSNKIKGYLLMKSKDVNAKQGQYMTRMNVSWECYDKLPQLFDLMKDRNLSQEYRPNIYAVDETSINTIEADKLALKYYIDEKTKEFISNGFYRPNFSPTPEELGLKTNEDIDDYFNSGSYNTQFQIAARACLDASYRVSNYMEQQDMCFDNHIINPQGLSGIKVYMDKMTGIPRMKTMDIQNSIIPWFRGKSSKGKITRAGELEIMTIGDVIKANPNLTSDDIKIIAQNATAFNPDMTNILERSGVENYYTNPYLSTRADNTSDNPLYSARVYVLDFQFLGEDIYSYLKNDRRGLFKEVDYDLDLDKKSEKSGDKKIMKNIVRKYHGKWVVGTDYFICYGECEDINYSGPEGRMLPEIDFYFSKHDNKSLIERCVAIVDDMWMRLIKERNIWATIPAAPAMIINKALIENVFLSGKKAATPEEIMNMFIEKGILVFDDRDPRGKPKIQAGSGMKPFEVANIGPLINFLSVATNDMLQKVAELKDVLGLSGGVDGDKSPYQGLGETQIALAASNSSLSPTFKAFEYLYKDVMVALIKMWQVKAKKEKGKKIPYSVIGDFNMRMVELSEQFINADLQIGVSIAPSAQEKQALMMDLKELVKASVQGGVGIDYSHYIYLYEKVLAGQLKEAMFELGKILAKQRKEAKEFELQKIRENVEGQNMSSQENFKLNSKLKEQEGRQAIQKSVIDNLLKTIKDLQLKSIERSGEGNPVDVQKTDALIAQNTNAVAQTLDSVNQPSPEEQQQMMEQQMALEEQQQMPLEPNVISQ